MQGVSVGSPIEELRPHRAWGGGEDLLPLPYIIEDVWENQFEEHLELKSRQSKLLTPPQKDTQKFGPEAHSSPYELQDLASLPVSGATAFTGLA